MQAIPENPKGIIIVVHGFTSSKESPTFELLRRRLPQAGFGMVGIDLPGHGTEESLKEILRIETAIDSIEAAEQYAVRLYPDQKIGYFASSFGAYLTALYISRREHKGRKAFFRSAAVNMPDMFIRENPTEEEKRQLEELETKGYFDTSMDLHRPVRVTKGLMEDFRRTNLFECFEPERFGPHSIHMAHGLKDEVIDPAEAKRFSEQFRIPVTWFKDEGHSLSNDPATPEKVADLAIELYS